MENEIFKVITEYPDYQVSNFGRIKSLKCGKERILKQVIDSSGYYQVNFYKDKKRKNFTVHKLVAMTFLNHIPNGHEIIIDHKNENKLDNRLENLQLISHRKNISKSFLINDKLSSSFTGVSWFKRDRKWKVHIQINKKIIHLGYFEDEIEASKIYQKSIELMDQYTGCNKTFRVLVKSFNIK